MDVTDGMWAIRTLATVVVKPLDRRRRKLKASSFVLGDCILRAGVGAKCVAHCEKPFLVEKQKRVSDVNKVGRDKRHNLRLSEKRFD